MSTERIPLTQQMAIQLSGAISELVENATHSIRTAELDAKKTGLENFLRNNTVQYLDEFLACWFAVHHEYEPLIQGVAALLSRSQGILAQKAQARAQTAAKAQTAAPQSQPDNVVPLNP